MAETRKWHLSGCVTVMCALLWSCSADSGDSGSRPDGKGPRDPDPISRPGLAGSGAAGSNVPVGTGNPTWNPQPAAGSGSTPVPGSGGDMSCAAISQQAENQRKPADIIFAVDNSGSMDEEIVFVREQLNAFSQQIVASGIDVRIILISQPMGGAPPPPEDFWDDDDDEEENGICIAPPLGSGVCPEDSKAPGYFHVPQEVRSSDALNLFVEYFPQYQAQLRPDATKTFVVVTDDDANDAPNNSAATFTQSVMGLPGGLFPSWTFSGIYCFSECPDAAEIGTVYNDLVMQTKGVAGDLCLQDFAPVFDALAKAVVASSGLACSWDIPAPPAGQTFNRQQVNVQYTTQGAMPQGLLQVSNEAACGTRSGWYYDNDADPKQILACPATCGALQNDVQAKIDVLFGCDTQVAPD